MRQQRANLNRLITALLVLLVAAALAATVGPLFLPYRTYAVLSGSMAPGIPVGALVIERQAARAGPRPEPGRRGSSAFGLLAVPAALIVAGLLVYREHPLVQLATDPPDSSAALFPTGDLQRGQSTTAAVSLANRGLIPFTY